MKNIIYRKYRSSDAEPVQKMLAQLGYPMDIDEVRFNVNAVDKKGGEIIVAQKGEMVVGSVCVVMDARLAEGVSAEVVSLVVLEECRGEGIGECLIHEAEKWASTKTNVVRIRANAIRENAHRFYNRLGYDELKLQKVFFKSI